MESHQVCGDFVDADAFEVVVDRLVGEVGAQLP